MWAKNITLEKVMHKIDLEAKNVNNNQLIIKWNNFRQYFRFQKLEILCISINYQESISCIE